MSEHSEDIDDIMHHYDSSNEAEKQEMFEDLLFSFYAKDDMHHYDNSNEAEKREMFEGLLLSFYAKGDEEASTFFFVLVSFWVIGGFFICNIIYNHFPVISSYFSGGFFETCGAWFLAVVAWSVVAFFCTFHGGFVVSLIILCLLAFANTVL